jgi:hypothetical protein
VGKSDLTYSILIKLKYLSCSTILSTDLGKSSRVKQKIESVIGAAQPNGPQQSMLLHKASKHSWLHSRNVPDSRCPSNKKFSQVKGPTAAILTIKPFRGVYNEWIKA